MQTFWIWFWGLLFVLNALSLLGFVVTPNPVHWRVILERAAWCFAILLAFLNHADGINTPFGK